MMFNGLLMYGDSDNSDFKESVSRSSGPASASGECDVTRADYYHNKLLATMQILQNKEETVRVQAESLAVAEARIASLTARNADLRSEIDKKTRELNALRTSINSSKIEKTDVSTNAHLQELEQQKNMVTTLQNNLGVIEKLYRECFYESAKQEGLIEMLRSSYLDVRMMEKEKSNQVGRLQNVINTRKWSFEQCQCQDLVAEVENLKMDISNFLNSSNNDSGMWERVSDSVIPGVGDDLQDIMDQLLRLREFLAGDCTCGLGEENTRLKESNVALELQVGALNDRIRDLETTLLDKESLDFKLEQEINKKEEELNKIRQEMASLEESSNCHISTCDTLSKRLQRAEELMNEKSEQMAQVQQICQTQEKMIQELKGELCKTEELYKENCEMKGDISHLTSQMSMWRSQLYENENQIRSLEAEMARLTNHCTHVDQCYKEKAHNVSELQSQLEEAHERGAVLCAEARHAACAVRHWVRRMRAKHKEQEIQIKEKDALVCALQKRLEERQMTTGHSSASENEICISCIPNTSERSDSYTSCLGARQKRTVTISASEKACKNIPSSASYTIIRDGQECPRVERGAAGVCTSGSEMAGSSAPVPPKRLLRKKSSCADKRWRSVSASRDACVQLPVRRDASTCFPPQHDCSDYDVRHLHVTRLPRELSPSEELMSRVERLSEALADGQRRWTRARCPTNT